MDAADENVEKFVSELIDRAHIECVEEFTVVVEKNAEAGFFAIELDPEVLKQVKESAIKAFGEEHVKTTADGNKLLIKKTHLKDIKQIIKRKTQSLTGEIDPDVEAQKLIAAHPDACREWCLAVCDAIGVKPGDLSEVIAGSLRDEYGMAITVNIRNALAHKLRFARNIFSRAVPEMENNYRYAAISSGGLTISELDATILEQVAESLPSNVNFTPIPLPLDRLRALLNDPNAEALLNDFIMPESEVFLKTRFRKGKVIEKLSRRTVPSEEYIQLANMIIEAVKGIDEIQRAALATEKESGIRLSDPQVRKFIAMEARPLHRRLAEESRRLRAGLNSHTVIDMPTGPTVLAWLDETLDALHENAIRAEIAGGKDGRVSLPMRH